MLKHQDFFYSFYRSDFFVHAADKDKQSFNNL